MSTEFQAKVSGSDPLTTKGHKPGVLATEADKVPEFHAETLPPGTAPPEQAHTPNPDIPNDPPSALSTLPGSTSADLHTGFGHPGQGQTSAELHGGGVKKERSGLEGVGAKVEGKLGTLDTRQRGLEREEAGEAAGTRGNIGGPSAEERLPQGAETVARENKLGR